MHGVKAEKKPAGLFRRQKLTYDKRKETRFPVMEKRPKLGPLPLRARTGTDDLGAKDDNEREIEWPLTSRADRGAGTSGSGGNRATATGWATAVWVGNAPALLGGHKGVEMDSHPITVVGRSPSFFLGGGEATMKAWHEKKVSGGGDVVAGAARRQTRQRKDSGCDKWQWQVRLARGPGSRGAAFGRNPATTPPVRRGEQGKAKRKCRRP
ncbi:hypothetical protein EDB83DRAFT_2314006 [Lactarius deliciosus]|nr:hypothetical protein EDB83DRAFT_2314006 [Lactarius deliciosus]